MSCSLLKKIGQLILFAGILISFQMLSVTVEAAPLTTTSFSCSISSTGTSSCVTGAFATFGTSSTNYWQYTLSTVGYSGITMQFNASSSATGPTTGTIYYNTGCGPDVNTGITYSATTCGLKGPFTLPAACNNIPNLTIKLVMSGGSGTTGTSRVNSDGGFQGTATTFPSVAISNISPSAGNIGAGTVNNLLQIYSLATTSATATLAGLTLTTAGTYSATDITNLKCWYDVTPSFNPATATLLSTYSSPGAGGSNIAFPSFVSQNIAAGVTGYLFITTDVAVAATIGNTINFTTTSFCNFNFGNATLAGTNPAAASNTQTIVVNTACSGTPSAGTASPSVSNICGSSGSSILSLTGGSSGPGIKYQWSSSSTNTPPGTNIPGATTSTYLASTISATTYFWCTTTCTASGLSNISSVGTVNVNPFPTVGVTPPAGGNICSGGTGLGLTGSGALTYTWAPSTGLSATTGTAVTANPTATTTYTITGTGTGGCASTTTVTVNYNSTPTALTIAPTSLNTCQGTAPSSLVANGGNIPGTATVSSGTVSLTVNPAGAIVPSNLSVSSIPTGATITNVAVTVNFTSSFLHDYIINLVAPDGQIINLSNHDLPSGAGSFTNTVFTSSPAAALSTSASPYTGTFAADAASATGPAGYISTTTSWPSLFTTPNGTWTLVVNNANTFADISTLTSWAITVNYSHQAAVTWAPATQLYTDALGTIPYTGSAAGTVYLNPLVVSVNTYTVVATNSICSSTATVTATVNPLSPVSGTNTICQGLAISLSDATAPGTWSSSNTAKATVNTLTGSVLGIAAGSATITYTTSLGCAAYQNVTINPVPAVISGTTAVCQGLTTALTDASGGTWSSSNSTIATVNSSTGIVSGVLAGVDTINYVLSTGCKATTSLTVEALPAGITGPTNICTGTTTAFSDAGGGTWSSSNTAIATIHISSGMATGITAGTTTITYTLPTGCITTTNITVFTSPAAITGTTSVCAGLTTALTDAGGGTWSSSNTTIASVDLTGVVTGTFAGIDTIIYTLSTGCMAVAQVIVNPLPASISGATNVCVGNNITMSDAGGGTWASSSTSFATIDALSGMVSGISSGTTTITFTFGTGCIATIVVTVNPLPSGIFGTNNVCNSLTTTLTDAGGGTWASSNTSVANVGFSSGLVTGISAGTSKITYELGTGCMTSIVVTVNPLPLAISGNSTVCLGDIASLSDIGGGMWTSTNTALATVDGSGNVTGVSPGAVTIIYSLPTGCIAIQNMTVNPLPIAISGATAVCVGSSSSLSDIGSGTWSSSNTTVATANMLTGVLAGVRVGAATITYTLGTGCMITAPVTVNPLPGAITGTATVCAGDITTLSDSGGGTWASGNTTVATVNSGSGVVTGVSANTAIITYTLSTGCTTTIAVTVNPLPAPISGSTNACVTTTSLLNDAGGGTWLSSSTSNVTIGLSSGIATSILPGTSTITYTLPTGCMITTIFTADTLPAAISGLVNVCLGTPASFSDITPGGAWTSSNTAIATVGISSGTVNGVAGGSATITYALTTGCQAMVPVTVNAVYAPMVTISSAVGDTSCTGARVIYTATPVGGGVAPTYAWVVNGTAVGTTANTYSYVPVNGDIVSTKLTSSAPCTVYDTAVDTMKMTVLPNVTPTVSISADPGSHFCQGTSVVFTATPVFGGTAPVYVWNQNGANIAVGATYTYTPANGDHIYCIMASNIKCNLADTVSSNHLIMAATVAAIPAFTLEASPGVYITHGYADTFNAVVTSATPFAAQWFINKVKIPGATGVTFICDTLSNKDSVTCVISSTDICGMSTFNSIVVNVNTLGINPVNKVNGLTVSPNPNKGEFVIKGSLGVTNDEQATIEITDMIGRVIYKDNITAASGYVNELVKLKGVPANGTYILSIRSATGSDVFHIIIER